VQVIGGGLRDSFLVKGVAFKKTFSYAGFEQQPKAFDSKWHTPWITPAPQLSYPCPWQHSAAFNRQAIKPLEKLLRSQFICARGFAAAPTSTCLECATE
jgi:hypothetical protein